MTIGSDNVFPKLILVEGAAPASPAATDFKLYVDSSDHLFKMKNSAGVVTTFGAGLADHGTLTYLDATGAAAPGTPASGKARVYAKTDGRIYSKNDAGTEFGPFDVAGSSDSLPTSGFARQVKNLAPVGYWRFNEPRSFAIVDYSGTANHGVIGGTYTRGAGGFISGDATSDSVSITATTNCKVEDNATVDLGDVVSIIAIIRPTSVTGQHGILSKDAGGYYLRTNGTNLNFLRGGVADIVSSTGITLAINTTYFVAVTKTGATVKLYVNGVDRTGTVTNSTLADTSTQVVIGCGNAGGAEPFAGRIAEVALFGIALTATNISDLYTASGL